jgi:hypothetical protein
MWPSWKRPGSSFDPALTGGRPINSRTLQIEDEGTPLEVPRPILFNTWKHHAGSLRLRAQRAIEAGEAGLEELAERAFVLGSNLMDWYIGHLSPREISLGILEQLREAGHVQPEPFRRWVEEHEGYRVLTLAEDGSRWVVGMGDEANRYIHLHPGRWSPRCLRVKANVLKTALLTVAHVGVHGGDPMDLELVDEVRRRYLGMSPLGKDLSADLGIGKIIEALLTNPTR